jgi:hypothetical protein
VSDGDRTRKMSGFTEGNGTFPEPETFKTPAPYDVSPGTSGGDRDASLQRSPLAKDAKEVLAKPTEQRADHVGEALAAALERASLAGEWSVVTALAAELAARRTRG